MQTIEQEWRYCSRSTRTYCGVGSRGWFLERHILLNWVEFSIISLNDPGAVSKLEEGFTIINSSSSFMRTEV